MNEILNAPLALEKIPWYESPTFIFSLVGFQFAAFIMACLAISTVALVRRIRKTSAPPSRLPRRVSGLAFVLSLLNIAFYIGIVVSMSDLNALGVGVSWTMKGVLTLPMISVAVTITYLFAVFRAWRTGGLSRLAGLGHGTLCVASLTFFGVLITFNLLGYFY